MGFFNWANKESKEVESPDYILHLLKKRDALNKEEEEKQRELYRLQHQLKYKKIDQQKRSLFEDGLVRKATREDYETWFKAHFKSEHFRSHRLNPVEDLEKYISEDYWVVLSRKILFVPFIDWCGASSVTFIVPPNLNLLDNFKPQGHCSKLDSRNGSTYGPFHYVLVDSVLVEKILKETENA